MENQVLLVGAGYMAIEYTKVLNAMQIPVIVVGRGEKSAKNFQNKTGLDAELGGIEKWLKEKKSYPNYAIVATTGTESGKVCRALIKNGIKNILLEKPGGIDDNDIKSVSNVSRNFNATILIAYNRHFYTSVLKAKEIIEVDEGVTSFFFDFTEWSHVIENIEKPKEIKKRWLLHNSTHVIDLAFYLGGEPKEVHSYVAGGLKWHPSGSIYVGAGITDQGKLFSYHSNWNAPGRWGLEILTKEHRLIFRPLEKLKIQKKGSIEIKDVELEDVLDVKFKPGLFRQVDTFLNGDIGQFTDIHLQVSRLNYYNKIMYGSSH